MSAAWKSSFILYQGRDDPSKAPKSHFHCPKRVTILSGREPGPTTKKTFFLIENRSPSRAPSKVRADELWIVSTRTNNSTRIPGQRDHLRGLA